MAGLQLRRAGLLLGTLHDVEWEMFWSRGKFEPTAAFAPYQSLFDEDWKAVQSGQWEAMETCQDRISELELCLVSEDGSEEHRDLFLHLHDGMMGFRYL